MSDITSEAVERGLISLILIDYKNYDIVKRFLGTKVFKNSTYSFLYSLCEKHQEWTWNSIADSCAEIENRPRDLDYPISYISDLISNCPPSKQLDFLIKVLSDRKIKESLIVNVDKIKNMSLDSSVSISDIYKNFKQVEDIFLQSIGIEFIRKVGNHNLWGQLRKDIEELSNGIFIGTGFRNIDKYLTWGFAPGMVSIISGRPSHGKSSFRANIQKNLAKIGIYTLIISKEQNILDEYLRHISIQTGISVRDIILNIRGQNTNTDDFDSKFTDAIKVLQNWPHMTVEPRGIFNLNDIGGIIEECYALGQNPKVIFVDLFDQLDDINIASDAGTKAALIQQKLGEARMLARKYQVHFCGIAQLRRYGKDKGKVARDEQYKGSGGYEEHSDLAFQIERPGQGNEDIEDNIIKVTIAKQRQGETKTVSLGWVRHCLTIKDEDRSNEEEAVADLASF